MPVIFNPPPRSASGLTPLHPCASYMNMPLPPRFREVSRLLKVNVMAYDYSGYGLSSAETPSEEAVNMY